MKVPWLWVLPRREASSALCFRLQSPVCWQAWFLGIGRAIGETMAVVMVAGNQARMPAGLLKGVRTMTTNIVLEMGYAADLHRGALIATGVVLFVFILIINFSVSMLNRRKEQ